jgi:hypothetical protein
MTGRSTQLTLGLLCCLISVAAVLAAPAGAAGKWTKAQLPPSYVDGEGTPRSEQLNSVSCPSRALCVAVGAADTLAFSQDPTGGIDKWHVIHPSSGTGPGKSCVEGEPGCLQPFGRLVGVSCASERLCVAVSKEGFIYASTDPTGGAGAWNVTLIEDGQKRTHLAAVSCPSPSFCAAVSGGGFGFGGKVLTSTNPTAGHWEAVEIGESLDFRGVSCGTPAFCVAVARPGQIFFSSDPNGGRPAWKDVGTPGGAGDLEGVDCVSTVLCAAGNLGGNILTSGNPASAASWKQTNAGGSVLITGISCLSASLCLAVDNNGDVLTSTDPTGGSGAWTFENIIPFPEPGSTRKPFNALFGVSCASPSLCVAVGSDGQIFASTDPFSEPAGRDVRGKTRKAVPRPRTNLMFSDYFSKYTFPRGRRAHAGFRFYSPHRVRGFECKRDQGRYRPCRSPLRYWASRGRHVLRVRATGLTGLHGRAAIKRFCVMPPYDVADPPGGSALRHCRVAAPGNRA